VSAVSESLAPRLGLRERLFIARVRLDAGDDAGAQARVLGFMEPANHWIDPALYDGLLRVLVSRSHAGTRARLVLAASRRGVILGSQATVEKLCSQLMAETVDLGAELGNLTPQDATFAQVRRDLEDTQAAFFALGGKVTKPGDKGTGDPRDTPRVDTKLDPIVEGKELVFHAIQLLCRDTFGVDPDSDANVRDLALKDFAAAAKLVPPQEGNAISKKAQLGPAIVAARQGDTTIAQQRIDAVIATFGSDDRDGSTSIARLELELASGKVPAPDDRIEDAAFAGEDRGRALRSLVSILGARVHFARALAWRSSAQAAEAERAPAEREAAFGLLRTVAGSPPNFDQQVASALRKVLGKLTAEYDGK
jgi:hypothetical protein